MANFGIDPFSGLPSNADPLTMSNPWMGGNNNVGGVAMPSLFGLGPSSSGAPAGGVSFTPDYAGGSNAGKGGSDPFAYYTNASNMPASISTGTNYDSVLMNSARSQADYNAKLNANIISSYQERLRRGEQVEDPTPYLWETDFNKILSYGQQGLPGNGLDPKYANGPSYYPMLSPPGSYNALTPETAAKIPGWDGLGVNTSSLSGLLGGSSGAGNTVNNVPGSSNQGPLNGGFTRDQLIAMEAQLGQSPYYQFLNSLGGASAGSASGTSSTQPYNTADVDYWRSIVQKQQPYDVSDYFNKLRLAMDESTKRNAGNLNEYFNATGNRYSSAFGDSMSDFWEQTNRDQNALLAQLGMQSYETERNRQFSGAQGLANLTSQISENQAQRGWQSGENALDRGLTRGENELNRAFSWDTQGRNLDFQQWLTDSQQAFQAAMYNAGAADQSSMALLNNATNAANQLNQNSIFGSNNLFNAENLALGSLYGNAFNSIPLYQQANQFAQGMGLNTANAFGNLFNAQLGIGSQFGGQQYQTYQDQINRAYQEWLRTQPWYHPFLQYQQNLALAQPGVFNPQYQPSVLNQIGGLLGSLLPFLRGLGGN